MTELRFTEEAERHVFEIQAWWSEHRSSDLFAREFLQGLDAMLAQPLSAKSFGTHQGVEIRRWLLPRSRYHVYFSYNAEADLVLVRAVWYASRGGLPNL